MKGRPMSRNPIFVATKLVVNPDFMKYAYETDDGANVVFAGDVADRQFPINPTDWSALRTLYSAVAARHLVTTRMTIIPPEGDAGPDAEAEPAPTPEPGEPPSSLALHEGA